MISRSLDKMYGLCKYSDREYNKITFKDYDFSRHGDEIQMLKDMCIVSGRPNHRIESIRMMRSGETYFEPQAPALIGEFLKVIVKLVALNDGIQFYEDRAYELKNQKTSYTDISKYAWYRPYVIYGERKGLLDNVSFGIVDSELKPLTRITQDVAQQMLDNADVDKDYFDMMGDDMYVSRIAMAKIVVDAFPEKFAEYEHLFGKNVSFYEGLIKILERKSPADQRAYVQHLITQMEKLDAKSILRKFGLDINGIIKYLKKLLTY